MGQDLQFCVFAFYCEQSSFEGANDGPSVRYCQFGPFPGLCFSENSTTAVTTQGVATLSHGDVDTAIFGSITLGAGTFTMCYTHNAVAVQLSSAFTIYPGMPCFAVT